MGGVQVRKLLRTHVVVVFGATSRVGKATIQTLSQHHEDVTVVLAVERPKDPRVKRLRRATDSYAVQCDFNSVASMRRVVRNADAVLLVPALSASGTQFSKRVIDACVAEDVNRLVLISSLLATDDYWRQGNTDSYEAIEAHARNLTDSSVALRIPLLMETLLYCRDEVVFANRFFSCFQPTTPVPCIAVKDVALAASHVLTQPRGKFDATYSLANAQVTCSPLEIERLLTEKLGRPITAKYVSEEKLTQLLKEKGASELVAANMIRMKRFIEMSVSTASHAALQTQPPLVHSAPSEDTKEKPVKAPLPLTRVGFSNDFQTLLKRALTSPRDWLRTARPYFERSPENQMQLFVMGSGEGLFQEVERLVAQQVTAPLAASPADDGVGEAAIPTKTGSAIHSKVTFCTVKTMPIGRQQQQRPHTAEDTSPMLQLLGQLTPADVVLFVPPLRFGATECMEVLRVTVDAARRAGAWGIVVVSSIFTGRGWADSTNRMGEMEQFLEQSGVPYAIVRLPLLMEYFLTLSPSSTGTGSALDDETEVEPEPTPSSTGGKQPATWPLLGRALASTPQYFISTADAAKALVAVAYTFPLHRNKIRTVYTECRTMLEIEGVLQKYAYKGARIDFGKVDALHETPGHEFWRVSYWPRGHVKQYLETAVALSGDRSIAPLEEAETFQDITECQPVTFERWAARHSKIYTHTLALGNPKGRKKTAVASTKPRPHYEDTRREHGRMAHAEAAELKPIVEEEKEAEAMETEPEMKPKGTSVGS